MPIAVGAVAPDFTLKRKIATGLEDVTLSQHKGKEPVVLLFFPAAFTGVCTDEMCNRVGMLGDAASLGAAVYGISTDSAYAQEAWAKAAGIQVPLLSDYRHAVVKAYDVEWPDLSGLGPSAARAAVVVGKDGLVKDSEQMPKLGDMPNFEEIKSAVRGA